MENFIEKKKDIFAFAQNIDCQYMVEPLCYCGSNEYPQSMFWVKNKIILYTPLETLVLLYKIGVSWGYTFHGHVFLMKDQRI